MVHLYPILPFPNKNPALLSLDLFPLHPPSFHPSPVHSVVSPSVEGVLLIVFCGCAPLHSSFRSLCCLVAPHLVAIGVFWALVSLTVEADPATQPFLSSCDHFSPFPAVSKTKTLEFASRLVRCLWMMNQQKRNQEYILFVRPPEEATKDVGMGGWRASGVGPKDGPPLVLEKQARPRDEVVTVSSKCPLQLHDHECVKGYLCFSWLGPELPGLRA